MEAQENIAIENGTIYDCSGRKIAKNVSGKLKVLLPVILKRSVRDELSNTYHEKLYYCPECRTCLAIHNGVIWLQTHGHFGQKFCHECGYKLNWDIDESAEDILEDAGYRLRLYQKQNQYEEENNESRVEQ